MDYALAGGVILSGLTIVFVVLILLTLIVALFGKLLGGAGNKEKPTQMKEEPAPTAAPAPKATVQPVVEDGISDETVAVISASIAAMLGGNAVVRGVKCAHGNRGKGRRTPWGMAGMQQNTSPF